MKKVFRKISALIGASMLVINPTLASASDITLKLEPGVAATTSAPQTDKFEIGGDLTVKPLFSITNWFGVGPSLSYLNIPAATPEAKDGVAWSWGLGVRIMRPRDKSNTSTGFAAASPWIDADIQYVRTGGLSRPGFMVGAGVSVPTSVSRTLWVGPFIRYQDIMQQPKTGFDPTDAHVFIAGVSLEFGGPVKKPARVCDEGCKDTDRDGVPDTIDRCPTVPGPITNSGCPEEPKTKPTEKECPQVQQVSLKGKIQFQVSSAEVQSAQEGPLSEAVRLLNENKNWHLQINGHASSDGSAALNNKLASARASAVLNYLAARGVSKDRMSAKGFGSTVPVASNSTLSGREANRRTEFSVDYVIVKSGESK
jgi:outer membrane protein OmpA-like peptidoglycan-associated protein